MPKIIIFMVLCVVGALLGSGCMSSRMVTDLKPTNNPELKSPAGTFYVADVKYSLDANGQASKRAKTAVKFQRMLLPLLRKECVDRYPGLFSNDESSSIPLGMTAEGTTTSHVFVKNGWMLCTCMIAGLILPCPTQNEQDFVSKVGIWTGREEMQSAVLQKSFRREIHTWFSVLTPVALIPVLGESDFPKITGSFASIRENEQVYVQQLASQLATALAETIAAKDPEFWTTQPRLNNPPIFSPTQPVDVLAAPPVPTDSPMPF